MNKDFFTKPISLKDIKIPRINFKDIKNKKIIAICIFIIIFLIGILIVCVNLLEERNSALDKRETAKNKYMLLQKMLPKETIENEILLLTEEMSRYEEKLKPVKPKDFVEVLKDFKTDAPIKWEDTNADTNIINIRDLDKFSVYRVNIKSFTGSLEDIENFLIYVKEYEKVVRIDSLSFYKNEITGRLTGDVSLSFYFDKLEE